MKSTGVTSKTDCPLGQQEPLEVILEMLGDEDEVQEDEEEEQELEDEDEYAVDVGEMVLVDDQGEAVYVLQDLGSEHRQETEENCGVEMNETYIEAKNKEGENSATAVESDEKHSGGLRDKKSTASLQEIYEAEVAEEATAETVLRHEGPSPLTKRDMTSLTNRRASLTQRRFRSFDEGSGDETYPNEGRELKLGPSLSSEGVYQSISSSSDSNQTVIEFDTRGGSVTSVNDRKLSDLGRSSTDDSVANLELDSTTNPNNMGLPVESTIASGSSQKMEDIDLNSESNNEVEECDHLSAVENSIEALDAMEWESTASTHVVKRYLPFQRQAFRGDKSLSSSSEKDEGEVDPGVEDFLRDDDKNNAIDRERKGNAEIEGTPEEEEERRYSVLDPDYIERENRKIQKFIDSLYANDETNEKMNREEERNASESVTSTDSCQDALDLLSKSSTCSDPSKSSLFRSIVHAQDEERRGRREADYKRTFSTEITEISEVTEDSRVGRMNNDRLLIKENIVTKSEAKVKHEATEDRLSTSTCETFPTLRRSRSRERSKSPLEERKSFSEFSSPHHERVASALKHFDRSESPIGRCRSLSPINIRLERIHRVHLKPLTSHSLNLSLERIHKINLPPLAAFSHSASDDITACSGERFRKFDKVNMEPAKQASAKEEQQIFELNSEEELKNLGVNDKSDIDKQKYSYSYREIIRPSEHETIGEEPQRLEVSKEEKETSHKAFTTEQASCLANSAERTSIKDEVKMQKSNSCREEAPPKLGTLKRSNTIDFKTDIEDVDSDLEKPHMEQPVPPREYLVARMKSLTSESDVVEQTEYTKLLGEKDMEHHNRPEKSEEKHEIPLSRSSDKAILAKENKSFDSGPSISDEEGDSREYIDPRVEDWVQHSDIGMGMSIDEDTSGSEIMKEEETSSKTDDDEDDHEDLPHFYDSDGTTPVAEIRHLPGELFTQDSYEEAEKRELWRSISQSTTPPNSPVTSPPPPLLYEDMISQQPESGLSQRGEDLITFSEGSGASSVVSSIHHNASSSLLPNPLRNDIPLDTEMASHPELISDDSFTPINLTQTSIVSSSRDFENDGKEYISDEESPKERRMFGDRISDNSSREGEALQEIADYMSVVDTNEHTNNNEHPKGSGSDIRLNDLRDSVDKDDSSRENRSGNDMIDIQDSKAEEESHQEYRSYGVVGRDSDSVKDEESFSKSRRAPVVTAGGNFIYYEEDVKEYEHDKDIIDIEHSTVGEDSLCEQGNYEDMTDRRESVSGEELSLKGGSDMEISASQYISDKRSHESGSNISTPENELQTIFPLEIKYKHDSVSDRSFIDDSRALGLFPRKRRSIESEADVGDSVCKEESSSALSKEIRSNEGITYSLESAFEENPKAALPSECKSDGDEKEYIDVTYSEVSHEENLVTSRSIYHNGESPTAMPQRSESADSGGDPMKYDDPFPPTTSNKVESDVDENGENKDCLSLMPSKIQDGESEDFDSDNSRGEESLITLSRKDGSDLGVLGYSECTNLEESLVTISNTFRRVMEAVTDNDSLRDNDSQATASRKFGSTTGGDVGEGIQEEESIATMSCKSKDYGDDDVDDEFVQEGYLTLDTDRIRGKVDLLHKLDSLHDEESLATMSQKSKDDTDESDTDESIRDKDSVSSLLYKSRTSMIAESNSEFFHEESLTQSHQIRRNANITDDSIAQESECQPIAYTGIIDLIDHNISGHAEKSLASVLYKSMSDFEVDKGDDTIHEEEYLISISQKTEDDMDNAAHDHSLKEEEPLDELSREYEGERDSYDERSPDDEEHHAVSHEETAGEQEEKASEYSENMSFQECKRSNQVSDRDQNLEICLKPETNDFPGARRGICISHSTANTEEETENGKENHERLSLLDDCLTARENEKIEADVDCSRYCKARKEGENDNTDSDEYVEKCSMPTMIEKMEETGDSPHEKRSTKPVSIRKEDSYRYAGSRKPIDDSAIQDNDEYPNVSGIQQVGNGYSFTFFLEEPTRDTLTDENQIPSNTMLSKNIGNNDSKPMEDTTETESHGNRKVDNVPAMMETDYSKLLMAAECHNVSVTDKTEDDFESLPSDEKASEDRTSILHDLSEVAEEENDMLTLMEENSANLSDEDDETIRRIDGADDGVRENSPLPSQQQVDKASQEGSSGDGNISTKSSVTTELERDNGDKDDEEEEGDDDDDDDDDDESEENEDSDDLTTADDTSRSDGNKENSGCDEDDETMTRSDEERTPADEGDNSPGDTGDEQGMSHRASYGDDHCWTIKAEIEINSDDSWSTLSSGEQGEKKTGKSSDIESQSKTKESELNVTDEVNSFESRNARSKITGSKLNSENENQSSGYHSADDSNSSLGKSDSCGDKKLDTNSHQNQIPSGDTAKGKVQKEIDLAYVVPKMSKTDDTDDSDRIIENVILENQRCYIVTLTFLKKLNDRLKFSDQSAASAMQSKLSTTTTTTIQPDAVSANVASKAQPSTDAKSVSALHLAAEGRDYLMWCPDRDFDRAVSTLDVRGLVDLVQTLQDAMAVEQQTFDSLTQQLELISDPLVQQRLSAALCTSQTRLARLCSRNMRCFTQQALKARQKDESRSSSPRDSGLVVSSPAGASDVEGDARSPTTASFKNSLAFFQRAANVVATNSRSAPTEARKKDAHRRSSRGSSTCTSGSEDLSTGGGFIEDLPAGGDFVGGLSYLDGGGGEGEGGGGYGEDEYDLSKFEDHGTYEQVLFINGRPQYQGDVIYGDLRDERCGIGEPSDRSSSTRVRIDGSTGRSLVLQEASDVGSGGGGGGDRGSDSGVGLTPAHSVANYSSLPRRAHARARKGASAVAEEEHRRGGLLQEQREQPQVSSDLGGYVTLPRRKPYLNLRSVSCGPSPGSAEFDNDDLSYFKEKVGISRSSSAHAITRTQSCKEGLNHSSEFYNNSAYGLSRTQSFHDGLAGDFNAIESVKPKLQRAPSVDEILESVKSLRAKKNMVKSTPDLVGSQDSSPYHSASLTRHKGKTHRASGSASSLLGVRYNGSSSGGDPLYDRMPEPDYEQIRESSSASSAVTMNPYYENLVRDNYYENVHLKGEVIYDNPRPTEHHYDRVHNDIHYENLDYDDPVYENVHEKEPTYMNVSDSSTLSSTSSSSSLRNSKSKVYANLEPATGAQQKGSASSGSSGKGKGKPRGKVTVTGGSSVVEGLTYDVPRAATHIYDSPQKQVRSVMPTATQTQASEYDTPKSNRSVLPQSTQIVLQAKNEQKQRIDDIFADCDQDSLDGHDRGPDIPSPDYGSEEESETLDEKKISTKDSFTSSELADEGLGDSDSRSYYTEEQGLEVILEEPEEEYCSSATSEDDLQRDVDITHELKGERRSLDGSEGIGSAEGDCHSSGGSEHYAEEDCASSGIHSQDTPSPGPPVEDHSCDKDDLSPRSGGVGEEERIQKDRCVEIYPETVRQRQRNNNMSSNNKVDIKNWTSSSNKGDTNSPSKVKKFLPSVKALRNQFETGKTTPLGNGTPPNSTSTSAPTLSRKSSSSTSSLASSTLEKTSSTNSLASTENGSTENLLNADIRDFAENGRTVIMDPDEPVEPIFNQFKSVDEELKELMSKPPSTTGWNPLPLLKRLYYVPEAPKMKSEGTTYINIEGYLEKLPSGRKKATFWNAWKRRYFIAKDGILYYYQNNQTEKPSMKLPLMGGKVECMEPNMVGVDDGAEKDDLCGSMIGVDDGKGHYVVVRCSSRQEAERWRRALETHTVEDFSSQYVQPWPVPTNPALLRDTLVVDLGSCSVRAGVLASNPTLPQLFFPCVVATQRDTRRQTWGLDALDPDVRSSASLSFPIRPSHKITKYSVDLSAVSSLLQKTFADLKVDPKNYNLQLSVPRILNPNTQVELLKLLFDKFGCRSVNLTHQSILSLYAYNATSGIVVDLGERMDIVPVIDGYIVDGGVSRVPYGGYRILDHLRQFLYMRNVSLVTEVEGYILRYVLEKLCYCAQHYNTEKARCTNNPDNFEKSVSLSEFFQGRDCPYETISLDFGRFQSTEGVFNPDAWGLDHPGLHKLVHKAIQECSMDIRKEMSRSIFLVGGASQLPGLADRLTTELDNLTPPAIRPKVHCSPHRYHAAYLGACVLADSAAFQQSRITREEWNKYGNASIRKWSL